MRSLWPLVRIGALGLSVVVLSAAPSFAEPWPQRAVRVIVPNPPGTGLDVIARLFTERLSARWRQPVIVENLPGADGIVAAREFAGKRDNHTLLYTGGAPISINPLLHEKLPYDPDRDLVPIAATSENAVVIAVSATLGVGSLAELAQLA
jgi:tripartite-type tricarboxylate transporter receptor subunit TctC